MPSILSSWQNAPSRRHHLEIANRRYAQLYPSEKDHDLLAEKTSERTLCSWAARFQEAEVTYGTGYVGLLTQCFVTKLDQLRGNTQASKTPRHMERSVDPKRLAIWTLERFASRLSEYAHEVYDQMDHAALGQSPREAFEQGMLLAGGRSHRAIAYSENFLMQTRNLWEPCALC